jgi:hypothetical protein
MESKNVKSEVDTKAYEITRDLCYIYKYHNLGDDSFSTQETFTKHIATLEKTPSENSSYYKKSMVAWALI